LSLNEWRLNVDTRERFQNFDFRITGIITEQDTNKYRKIYNK